MGYEWIQHKGKNVLYVNYSECKNKEEMLALLEEMGELCRKSSGNLLTVDDFTGQYGTREFVARAKELGSIFREKRKKGAVLGITGVKKVLLDAYNLFTSDKMIPFDDKQKALDFVVSD